MTQQQKSQWKDIEPHRTTSAILVILNMRVCLKLWRAEKSLIKWARAYAHELDREDVALGTGDTCNILTWLFVLDSFKKSSQSRVNMNQTRFQANQLVAFPLLDSMVGVNLQMKVLHWNVIVNDLATPGVGMDRRLGGRIYWTWQHLIRRRRECITNFLLIIKCES